MVDPRFVQLSCKQLNSLLITSLFCYRFSKVLSRSLLDRCVKVFATVAMATNEYRDIQECCNNAHCVQCHGESQQIFPISMNHITVFWQPVVNEILSNHVYFSKIITSLLTHSQRYPHAAPVNPLLPQDRCRNNRNFHNPDAFATSDHMDRGW